MMSKKLEVMIERIWTLNLDELERLSNEIEAEIQCRDIDFRMEIGHKEDDEIEGLKRSTFYKQMKKGEV